MCHWKCVLFKEATYCDVAISVFSSTSQTIQLRLSDTSLHPPVSSLVHTADLREWDAEDTWTYMICFADETELSLFFLHGTH
jgi:hypothetical protein